MRPNYASPQGRAVLGHDGDVLPLASVQLVLEMRPGRRSCLQPSSDTHLRNLILSATTSSSSGARMLDRLLG